MAQLAIKGHITRGKEVIEILEMMGGTNRNNCWGIFKRLYLINASGDIEDISLRDNSNNSNYQIYTLEDFIKKFPYKVGDKVIYTTENGRFLGNGIITKATWGHEDNEMLYEVKVGNTPWLVDAKHLQPYKEETMEDKPNLLPNLLQQLKDYFDNTPRDVIEKEWHEYDKYNEIGPSVEEYLEYVNNIRRPKYPKTYEDCCKVLDWNPRVYDRTGYKFELLCKLQVLLICRDAYWKIAGEQMGLDKPWEPDYSEDSYDQGSPIKYVIYYTGTCITKGQKCTPSFILTFPTKEMRDAFYENFKETIEQCKELI